MTESNQTSFAIEFRNSTLELLESIANPTGEGFAYAYAMADRSHGYAHNLSERTMANTLRTMVIDAAKSHGINVRAW